MRSGHSDAGIRRTAKPYVLSAVLIAVPWLALLAVPLYARTSYPLFGLPMFYWWTFLWIVLLAVATHISYRIIETSKAANSGGDEEVSR